MSACKSRPVDAARTRSETASCFRPPLGRHNSSFPPHHVLRRRPTTFHEKDHSSACCLCPETLAIYEDVSQYVL